MVDPTTLLAPFTPPGADKATTTNLAAVLAPSAPALPDRGAALGRAIEMAMTRGSPTTTDRVTALTYEVLGRSHQAGGAAYGKRWSGLAGPVAAGSADHVGQLTDAVTATPSAGQLSGRDLWAAVPVLRAGYDGPSSAFQRGLQGVLDQQAATWRQTGSPSAFLQTAQQASTTLTVLTATAGGGTVPTEHDVASASQSLYVSCASAMLSNGLNTSRYIGNPGDPGTGVLPRCGRDAAAGRRGHPTFPARWPRLLVGGPRRFHQRSTPLPGGGHHGGRGHRAGGL